LFERAHRAGATTSLDTNLDPAGIWAGLDSVLPRTDVLLPNRAEVLGIAGRFGVHGGDAVEAATIIARMGPLVVVKDGAAGAFSVSAPEFGGQAEVRCAPGEPADAVDSTGAGDSFDAAFLATQLDGRPVADCLVLACRAGALSTRGVGGTWTQATAAELDPTRRG
jgi:ribokinase